MSFDMGKEWRCSYTDTYTDFLKKWDQAGDMSKTIKKTKKTNNHQIGVRTVRDGFGPNPTPDTS